MSNNYSLRPFASTRGLRNVPIIALSHNSIAPALSLTEAGVDFRIIRKHFLAYKDIEEVQYIRFLSHQITLVPKQRPWTFNFNYFQREPPISLLTQLDQRGISLAPKARAFLADQSA